MPFRAMCMSSNSKGDDDEEDRWERLVNTLQDLVRIQELQMGTSEDGDAKTHRWCMGGDRPGLNPPSTPLLDDVGTGPFQLHLA